MKHLQSFIKLTILSIILFPTDMNAQIVGGEAFLKGAYMEVGVSSRGAYGSFNNPPAGYHPRANNPGLGFVADVDQDGFGNGTPDFCGDYFLPGSPEEGWGLTVNGTDYNNNRANPDEIPGSISNFSTSATEQRVDWTGTVNIGPGAGLSIVQRTTLPVNGLYFVTRVTLTNTTGSTIPNVYYMRNVDPDQEASIPAISEFRTEQTIVDQTGTGGNTTDRALVEAVGLDFGCYLGIGAIGCLAPRVSFGGFANRNAEDIYKGLAGLMSSPGDTNIEDEAISIAFDLGDIPPAQTVELAYAHILNRDQLETALAAANCDPKPDPIPTMSQWGLLIFGLLVLNLSLLFIYQKQQIIRKLY